MVPTRSNSGDGDSSTSAKEKNDSIQVIRLWQLPANFFTLTSSQQWDAIEAITYPATAYPNAGPRQRRTPCAMSFQDDM